jgi:hypothetical protein
MVRVADRYALPMDARHIQAHNGNGMVLMPNVADIERLAGERTSDGKLPSFTFPGAYPLIYITHCAEVLCADCATDQIDNGNDYNFDPIIAVDVHWEGEDETCGDCNRAIPSAYGIPD